MIRPQSCPICRKVLAPNSASELDTFPFCSTRCREVDLYRWSLGKYALVENINPEDLELLALEIDDPAIDEAMSGEPADDGDDD
ncbi:MAG: DNA gyrase inhibitor YacG [Planctomycetaceae bacterium]